MSSTGVLTGARAQTAGIGDGVRQLVDVSPLLPVQWYPEGDGIMGSPCGMLVGAVLEDGIHQLHLGRSARGTKAQRLYRQTRSWFVGDPMPCERPARSDCRCDRCWPFSFVNICDTLNIPADVLRRLVLKDDFIGPDVPLPGAGRPVGRPAGRRWRTVSIHGMGKTRVCKRP